jgi:hypothetical protein
MSFSGEIVIHETVKVSGFRAAGLSIKVQGVLSICQHILTALPLFARIASCSL